MTDNRTTERFAAEYEGQGFFSFRKDGWPDYVTMRNGGDVTEGTYDRKSYISSDIFEGMRLFYENETEIRSKRIFEFHAKVDDLEGKIRDLCVAGDEDRAAYEARITELEQLVRDMYDVAARGEFDVGEEFRFSERMAELGLEVGQ